MYSRHSSSSLASCSNSSLNSSFSHAGCSSAGRFGSFFFEHWIGLQFLLYDVAQFQHRSLENHQALLQLRGQHLLHRQVLRLLHSGRCHTEPKNERFLFDASKQKIAYLIVFLERFLLYECFVLDTPSHMNQPFFDPAQ